jgi:hypothetical protein
MKLPILFAGLLTFFVALAAAAIRFFPAPLSSLYQSFH